MHLAACRGVNYGAVRWLTALKPFFLPYLGYFHIIFYILPFSFMCYLLLLCFTFCFTFYDFTIHSGIYEIYSHLIT
jgi:hypothetical protein